MTALSHPPAESSIQSPRSATDAPDGLEAPGLRPAALAAALIAGGAAWYVLAGVLDWVT